MSEAAVLTYFENRGFAEAIRMTLALAKIPVSRPILQCKLMGEDLCRPGSRILVRGVSAEF